MSVTGRPDTQGVTRPGVLERTTRAFALAGSLLVAGLSGLLVVSVAGRELLGRPVPGDFEIVSFGMAIAAFLCLPYCQLTRGNLVVDFFLARAPLALRAVLDAIAAAAYGAIALVFAWRMGSGMLDAIAYRDVSMILGLPYWWAYPVAVASLVLLGATCFATAARAWRERRP